MNEPQPTSTTTTMTATTTVGNGAVVNSPHSSIRMEQEAVEQPMETESNNVVGSIIVHSSLVEPNRKNSTGAAKNKRRKKKENVRLLIDHSHHHASRSSGSYGDLESLDSSATSDDYISPYNFSGSYTNGNNNYINNNNSNNGIQQQASFHNNNFYHQRQPSFEIVTLGDHHNNNHENQTELDKQHQQQQDDHISIHVAQPSSQLEHDDPSAFQQQQQQQQQQQDDNLTFTIPSHLPSSSMPSMSSSSTTLHPINPQYHYRRYQPQKSQQQSQQQHHHQSQSTTRHKRTLSSSLSLRNLVPQNRQVILPSEYQAIKNVAIQRMKKQRLARLAQWKDRARRARDGLASSFSMENLNKLTRSLSLESITSQYNSDCESDVGGGGSDDELSTDHHHHASTDHHTTTRQHVVSYRRRFRKLMRDLCFACWWNLDPPANPVSPTGISINGGSCSAVATIMMNNPSSPRYSHLTSSSSFNDELSSVTTNVTTTTTNMSMSNSASSENVRDTQLQHSSSSEMMNHGNHGGPGVNENQAGGGGGSSMMMMKKSTSMGQLSSSPSLGDLTLKESISHDKLYDVHGDEINDVKSIIIDLGYALSIYGMTSYRLDYHLSLIASYYGMICTSYSTPTGIWYYFGCGIDDPDRSSHFVKITSSSLNLSKLCQLDDLAERISKGVCSIKEARSLLTQILDQQSEYSHFGFRIVTAFIQAGMWSVIFGANWGEMVASFVAGLFIGLSSAMSTKFPMMGQVHTITSGVIAGIVGIAFKLLFRETIAISVFLVSLSGVVSLLPGLTFTLAIAELSVRHLMSGAQRIMHGFVIIIQLGFGILISDRMSRFVTSYITTLPEQNTLSRVSPPIHVLALTIPVVTSATIVNFKVPRYPLALFFIFLDAFAGYFTSYFSGKYFGREMGTLLGAFMIGMIANLFGWISRHPSIVVASCGIIYLVPGSFGIRSIGAFLQKDSDGGLSFIMDTFSTCISLTVGLLLADILGTKKKKLQL